MNFIYKRGAKKHFIGSVSNLITSQIAIMENSEKADFIWKQIGRPSPDLHRLFQMLNTISVTFYSVADIAIYTQAF
jgi:hypothetical protein